MKIIFPIVLLLFAFTGYSEPEFEPIVLGGTELHPLTSKVNDRPYQLMVSLPASYSENTDKRYPVLFVTDGYWDVTLIHGMYGNLIYDEVIPEFILVGLGYSDEAMDPNDERMYDLTPEAMASIAPNAVEAPTGGGEQFLKFIKTEAIPYVDKMFRTDPNYRVLGGSSMGGFFSIYTMLTDIELFDAYIAISPAVGIWGRWLFVQESLYRERSPFERLHTSLPARLFMSGAEQEWTGFYGEILAFNEILKHGQYEDFEYKFRVIDGERHAGTKAEGYSRGIRFAFKPYLEQLKAPQTDKK